ncbi:PREDICTED: uncharacterized protein LOC108362690 [Rhagoletis zephyria]|uniref:uncharacterized protein LOC108362690 n=1 Tax=Rhagoletis zephyria TaxID=28612 RepID=UPI0008114FB8|nr:PREDICTED: uncharacterized protein LOC108362690 [Rhagoletis zephyria]
MAADRFRLSEFSEFLDDTDGHRLAQFLQKKGGTVRPGRVRIFDSEPEHFSLNVRIKRVSSPPSPPTASSGENEKTQHSNIEHKISKEKIEGDPIDLPIGHVTENYVSASKTIQTAAATESEKTCNINQAADCNFVRVIEHSCSIQTPEIPRTQSRAPSSSCQPALNLPNQQPNHSQLSSRKLELENNRLPAVSENALQSEMFEQTERPASPHPEPTLQPLQCVIEPQRNCDSPTTNSNSQPRNLRPVMPQSPRSPLTNLIRSCGVNTADRLRRQVLKRLSTTGNSGRRTLLKEFESTLNSTEFAPEICSTPMHHTPIENLQRTPGRHTKTPSIVQSVEMVGDPVNEALQRSINIHLSQHEQPLTKNMVAALEETLKKLNEIENSRVQSEAVTKAGSNITVLPGTQEIIQQAQANTSENHRSNISNAPATHELLQEVQKALQDLRNSLVQAPKIVIPVNQTFNNASAQPENQNKESAPGGGSQQHDEPARQQILSNTVEHCIPLQSHAAYSQSIASENLPGSESIMEATLNTSISKNPHTFVNHPTFINSRTINSNIATESIRNMNSNSKHNRTSSFVARKTLTNQNSVHIEEGVEPLKEHSRKDHRSPMRPINQAKFTDNNRTTSQKKLPLVMSENSLGTHFQSEAGRKAHSTHTSFANFTPLNIDEASVNKASKNKISSVHTSRRLNCTNRNTLEESATARLARLSATEMRTSPLITEDEDDEELDYLVIKKRCVRQSGPLNLASEKPKPDVRSRRTIKRNPSKRRLAYSKLASPSITSDTDRDSGPPPAHPLNLQHATCDPYKTQKRLKRPLNKPPNTPKNGEMFADELKAHLARLTNHEILDLRKRNSLGQALKAPSRLRKSAAGDKQTLQEQLQIEEQIQMEILRRELLGEAEGLRLEVEQTDQIQSGSEYERVTTDDMIFNELPSAPAAFKDDDATATQQTFFQLTRRTIRNSSLLDDNSSEQVSFLPPTPRGNRSSQGKKSRKKKDVPLTETKKRYIAIQKKIEKRRQSNLSKRSLYTKGESGSEEDLHAGKVPSEKENHPQTPPLLEPIRPPPVISPIYHLHVPSPPPPLVASRNSWRAQSITTASPPIAPSSMQECVLPPAPFLDNSAEKSPTKTTNEIQVAQQQTKNDDAVFKKPTMPAPRAARKLRSSTKAKKAETLEVADSSATDSTDTQPSDEPEGLRRSKRGLVPRNDPPFLQKLVEAIERRSYISKMKRLEKSRLSEAANTISRPIASSTVRKTTAKANSRGNKKAAINPERNFSYLGDTNTTSSTTSFASCISKNDVNGLRPIIETVCEYHVDVVAAEKAAAGAQSTSVSEVPAASTKEKTSTKKTVCRPRKGTTYVLQSNAHVVPKPKARPRKNSEGAKNKKHKQQVTETEKEFQAEADALPEPIELPTSSQAASEARTTNRSVVLECSRVYLPPPPPLDKLNEMFDQLKNKANNSSDETSGQETPTTTDDTSSATISRNRNRKLRVRLRRLSDTTPTTTSRNVSSPTSSIRASTSSQTTNDNELLTWLKNVSHLQSENNHDHVFMDMRPSTAGRLYFTDLDGIDYAFYDTEEITSLGYLRFKPLQCKPLKRTKKYHLHFVVLAGKFQIGTEREHGTFGIGDMVAINIGCRYKITNLDNDVAILMVIKK